MHRQPWPASAAAVLVDLHGCLCEFARLCVCVCACACECMLAFVRVHVVCVHSHFRNQAQMLIHRFQEQLQSVQSQHWVFVCTRLKSRPKDLPTDASNSCRACRADTEMMRPNPSSASRMPVRDFGDLAAASMISLHRCKTAYTKILIVVYQNFPAFISMDTNTDQGLITELICFQAS